MYKRLLFALCCLMSRGNLWAQTYNIKDYGATNDTTKVCTATIQKAIDACWERGGGQVLEMIINRLSLITILLVAYLTPIRAVGASGMYQWSIELTGYISLETGKAPNAYLWLPENCKRVKAVIVAQQNMTEEALFRMESFRKQMETMDVGIIWVAPAFTNSWDPASGCQATFDEMMTGLAYQSAHQELEHCPIIPFGHSAQATFPWNFAAFNPDRTLCILSFHGDAPRTNLCGYGTANIEWGRTRNIDGIPGLMVEGEYEWWEARVRPALAFRMMYPESCISFLCDTGRGHFDCSQRTADYLAKFIEKSIKLRLSADGTLRKVNPSTGWLAERWLPEQQSRAAAAPYKDYKGDPHDAFWYPDREMAERTEARYAETRGKQMQYLGIEYEGKLVPYNEKLQGGMVVNFVPSVDSLTFTMTAVYTDSTHIVPSDSHSLSKPSIEVICGPVEKIGENLFRIRSYEAGMDNPRRSFNAWLVAVADCDSRYKGAVQPIKINLPRFAKK